MVVKRRESMVSSQLVEEPGAPIVGEPAVVWNDQGVAPGVVAHVVAEKMCVVRMVANLVERKLQQGNANLLGYGLVGIGGLQQPDAPLGLGIIGPGVGNLVLGLQDFLEDCANGGRQARLAKFLKGGESLHGGLL